MATTSATWKDVTATMMDYMEKNMPVNDAEEDIYLGARARFAKKQIWRTLRAAGVGAVQAAVMAFLSSGNVAALDGMRAVLDGKTLTETTVGAMNAVMSSDLRMARIYRLEDLGTDHSPTEPPRTAGFSMAPVDDADGATWASMVDPRLPGNSYTVPLTVGKLAFKIPTLSLANPDGFTVPDLVLRALKAIGVKDAAFLDAARKTAEELTTPDAEGNVDSERFVLPIVLMFTATVSGAGGETHLVEKRWMLSSLIRSMGPRPLFNALVACCVLSCNINTTDAIEWVRARETIAGAMLDRCLNKDNTYKFDQHGNKYHDTGLNGESDGKAHQAANIALSQVLWNINLETTKPVILLPKEDDGRAFGGVPSAYHHTLSDTAAAMVSYAYHWGFDSSLDATREGFHYVASVDPQGEARAWLNYAYVGDAYQFIVPWSDAVSQATLKMLHLGYISKAFGNVDKNSRGLFIDTETFPQAYLDQARVAWADDANILSGFTEPFEAFTVPAISDDAQGAALARMQHDVGTLGHILEGEAAKLGRGDFEGIEDEGHAAELMARIVSHGAMVTRPDLRDAAAAAIRDARDKVDHIDGVLATGKRALEIVTELRNNVGALGEEPEDPAQKARHLGWCIGYLEAAATAMEAMGQSGPAAKMTEEAGRLREQIATLEAAATATESAARERVKASVDSFKVRLEELGRLPQGVTLERARKFHVDLANLLDHAIRSMTSLLEDHGDTADEMGAKWIARWTKNAAKAHGILDKIKKDIAAAAVASAAGGDRPPPTPPVDELAAGGGDAGAANPVGDGGGDVGGGGGAAGSGDDDDDDDDGASEGGEPDSLDAPESPRRKEYTGHEVGDVVEIADQDGITNATYFAKARVRALASQAADMIKLDDRDALVDFYSVVEGEIHLLGVMIRALNNDPGGDDPILERVHTKAAVRDPDVVESWATTFDTAANSLDKIARGVHVAISTLRTPPSSPPPASSTTGAPLPPPPSPPPSLSPSAVPSVPPPVPSTSSGSRGSLARLAGDGGRRRRRRRGGAPAVAAAAPPPAFSRADSVESFDNMPRTLVPDPVGGRLGGLLDVTQVQPPPTIQEPSVAQDLAIRMADLAMHGRDPRADGGDTRLRLSVGQRARLTGTFGFDDATLDAILAHGAFKPHLLAKREEDPLNGAFKYMSILGAFKLNASDGKFPGYATLAAKLQVDPVTGDLGPDIGEGSVSFSALERGLAQMNPDVWAD